MAEIAVVPFMMGNGTITLGPNGYSASVSSARFEPATSIVKFKGITPTSAVTFTTNPEWTLVIEFAQDFATTNSLSNYLQTNQGTSVVAVLTPKLGGTPKTATATVTLVPGAIGGPTDEVATAQVTFGSTAPVIA